ncbi:hypothetical protein B9Z55_008583 [Caenorhabditis nigoni]|uniref:Calpain catalytic domain-containing protein n=2 Tax=Caenorhabditis nigoni TaxID=1611254 RepID=A0A2G5UN76_9PELO|nr:hypothetical protein B9Z55_008583 [Caenorhabditis nigoni]
MSFFIDIFPAKEEVFQKSDEECLEIVKDLRTNKEIYMDPEFPPTPKSLGTWKNDKNEVIPLAKGPWLPPHLLKDVPYRMSHPMLESHIDKWCLWENPWPFYVCQGRAGDCWLLAPLMTICRRGELMEQILPRNEYTMETGLVQVRMLINGQWEVILMDYHIPHINGIEQCAGMPRKQAWVALIEKAFAKTSGCYWNLNGGSTIHAFKSLTGAFIKVVRLHDDRDEDQLWEDMNKYYSTGFLMTASTPELEEGSEEWDIYKKHTLDPCHGYSILNFKEYRGHRLIQIGNCNNNRWSGKFSNMPNYGYDAVSSFNFADQLLESNKISWMEFKDFCRFFKSIHVCCYREGWSEKRLRQRVERKDGQDVQIIRLDVAEKCEMAIEVSAVRGNSHVMSIFLNLHRCCPESLEPGELLYSANDYSQEITFDESIDLEPGSYFVIAHFIDMNTLDLDWVFRSSKSVESFSLSFHICPFSTALKSVQSIFLISGKVDHRVEDQVIVYTWYGEKNIFVMVDNLRELEYCRFSGIIKSDHEDKINTYLFYDWPRGVPPRSRCIVGYLSYRLGEEHRKCEVDFKYTIRSRFLKFFDWLDSLLGQCEIEYSIKI